MGIAKKFQLNSRRYVHVCVFVCVCVCVCRNDRVLNVGTSVLIKSRISVCAIIVCTPMPRRFA